MIKEENSLNHWLRRTKEILKPYFCVNVTVNTMNLDPYYKVLMIISLQVFYSPKKKNVLWVWVTF